MRTQIARLTGMFLVMVVAGGCGATAGGAGPGRAVTPAAGAPAAFSVLVQQGYDGGPSTIDVVALDTGSVIRSLPDGVLSSDLSRLYSVKNGPPRIAVIEVSTGAELGHTPLGGSYEIPHGPGNGPRSAFSPDGHWLVLEHAISAPLADIKESHLVIFDTTGRVPVRYVDLAGSFTFDAIDNSGTKLYLLENRSVNGVFSYRVRLFDTASGRLHPRVIVDKRNPGEPMSGLRTSSQPSRDGAFLFSVYVMGPNGPFVHALGLDDAFAFCIDLPSKTSKNFPLQLLWSSALAPSGRLYAVNAAIGQVAEIDTSTDEVRRKASFSPPTPSPGFVGLIPWPVIDVEAKRLLLGNAAISGDGSRLYAPAVEGIVVIDTATMKPVATYVPGKPIDSLLLTPDGRRLIAVDAQDGLLLQIEPGSGRLVGTIKSGRPSGVLGVLAPS